MGTGWRRAFRTSTPRDQPKTAAAQRPESPGLTSCTRLGFFSSSSSAMSGGGGASSAPKTPRAQAEVVTPSSSLRCRTKWTASAAAQEGSKAQHQCKTNDSAISPRPSPRAPVAQAAAAGPNPASPRSPSRFALLKLRLLRSSCGVCLQSVKTGQGAAIFTAECSHAFHFPCIIAHVRKQGALVCPVCNTTWRQVPLLSNHLHMAPDEPNGLDMHADAKQGTARSRVAELLQRRKAEVAARRGESSPRTTTNIATAEKVYNDDEPLLSPGGAARFNPIAEGEEEEEDEDQSSDYEFQGFFPSQQQQKQQTLGAVQVVLAPDALLLSAGRSHDKYVVTLKVKAPPPRTPSPNASSNAMGSTGGVPLLDPSRRAPIDLVTVLDVGGSMTGAKLHMLKRAMRLVISSLSSADRLAIVGSAAAAKRLLPLRRMTPQGQRSARRIVDRLVCGHGNCVGHALRKATRVLEDRRERNPVSSIMLLSDGHQQYQQQQQHPPPAPPPQTPQQKSVPYRRLSSFPQHRPSSTASGTRFAHLEIPVQGSHDEAPPAAEDAFAKCVGGLLSVVVQDVRLQLAFPSGDITAVYNSSGQPAALGVGGGSIRLGDLYAEEERELLVEVRVPTGISAHSVSSLKAKCTYRDPATQDPVVCEEQAMTVSLPLPPSSAAVNNPKVERLRNLYVTTRAIVEARRLTDLNDFATALHLLSSARSLLLQSTCASAKENLALLESEVAEAQGQREHRRRMGPREPLTPAAAWRGVGVGFPEGEEGVGEPLTPTSAWRAAERLAKVAIMRKSMNRVSDLHGFENARF